MKPSARTPQDRPYLLWSGLVLLSLALILFVYGELAAFGDSSSPEVQALIQLQDERLALHSQPPSEKNQLRLAVIDQEMTKLQPVLEAVYTQRPSFSTVWTGVVVAIVAAVLIGLHYLQEPPPDVGS